MAAIEYGYKYYFYELGEKMFDINKTIRQLHIKSEKLAQNKRVFGEFVDVFDEVLTRHLNQLNKKLAGLIRYVDIIQKRNTVNVGVTTTIVIYPVLIYQLIIYRVEAADIGSMDITLVLFYIWWNLVMLGYLSWYFINIVNNKMSNPNNLNNDNNIKDDIKTENESSKEIDVNLTRREKEILSYLLDGKTNKEVSLILSISLNTVNNHVANIYEKSGVKNRVELVNKFSKN